MRDFFYACDFILCLNARAVLLFFVFCNVNLDIWKIKVILLLRVQRLEKVQKLTSGIYKKF